MKDNLADMEFFREIKNTTGKTRKFLLFGLVLCSVLISVLVFAYVQAAIPPTVITYQGKVLVNGSAATSSLNMKFVLYDALSGGNSLYTISGTTSSPAAVSITPSSGLFSVDLGGTGYNALNPEIFKNNSSVYLEITIGAEVLSPRKQIGASPYAFNAKYLDGVAASSTSPASEHILQTDVSGNLDLNNVTSTGLVVLGTSSFVTTTQTAFRLGVSTIPGYVLTADADGYGTWQAVSAGGLSGGATGTIPFWSSPTAISTTTLYWDNTNGRFGVGTSSPQYVLSVVGDASIIGTTYVQDILPTANLTYDLGSSTARWQNGWFETVNIGTSTWSITGGEDGKLSFFDNPVGGTERVYIQNDGTMKMSSVVTSLGNIYSEVNMGSTVQTFDNLFNNSSLEKNTGWSLSVSPDPGTNNSTTSIDYDNFFEGDRSVKLTSGNDDSVAMLYQTVSGLQSGTTYDFSYYAQGDSGGEKARVAVGISGLCGAGESYYYNWSTDQWACTSVASLFSNGNNYIWDSTVSGSFQRFNNTFVASSTNSVTFYIFTGGDSDYYNQVVFVDALQLEAGSSPTVFENKLSLGDGSNILNNSSFENNNVWNTFSFLLSGTAGGSSTFAFDSDAYDQDNSLRATVEEDGSILVSTQSVSSLSVGQDYVLSYYAKGAVGGESVVAIAYTDAGGICGGGGNVYIYDFQQSHAWECASVTTTLSSTSSPYVLTGAVTNGYTRFSDYLTVDASSTAFTIVLAAIGSGETVYFDAVQFEKGGIASAFTDQTLANSAFDFRVNDAYSAANWDGGKSLFSFSDSSGSSLMRLLSNGNLAVGGTATGSIGIFSASSSTPQLNLNHDSIRQANGFDMDFDPTGSVVLSSQANLDLLGVDGVRVPILNDSYSGDVGFYVGDDYDVSSFNTVALFKSNNALDKVVLTVMGHGGFNLTEWKNSSGSNIAYINSVGDGVFQSVNAYNTSYLASVTGTVVIGGDSLSDVCDSCLLNVVANATSSLDAEINLSSLGTGMGAGITIKSDESGGADPGFIKFYGNGDYNALVYGTSSSTLGIGLHLEATTSTGSLYFGTNTSSEAMVITPDGYVGIGSSTPAYPLSMGSGAHVTVGGAWENASSRDLKENFVSVTSTDILEKINELTITRWNYKNEPAEVTHIGPMAQEFYDIFGVGGNSSISTIDPAGIALVGIQALSDKFDAFVSSSMNSLSISTSTDGSIVSSVTNFNGGVISNVSKIIGVNNNWLIDKYGNFITRITTANGVKEVYGLNSPVAEIVFSSSSQLISGEAQINYDQDIKDIIDPAVPVKVTVTLTSGEASGIYVVEKNENGFKVKELQNGTSNATFDWIVVAKRKGVEVIETETTETPVAVGDPAPQTEWGGQSESTTSTEGSTTTNEVPTNTPVIEPVTEGSSVVSETPTTPEPTEATESAAAPVVEAALPAPASEAPTTP